MRLRNVSKTGMLIEGGTLPPKGTVVEIERGSAIATGRVAWVENGFSGIKLTSPIQIEAWLPTRSRAQSRVDEIVHELKLGKLPAPYSPATDHASDSLSTDDLCKIAAELEGVARSLAANQQMLAQFPEDIQRIDVAAQRLRKLAEKHSLRI